MASILLKIGRTSNSQLKCYYLKNANLFLNLFNSLESTSNFKHLKENMTVIANEFPKLQTVKSFDRLPGKKRRFGTGFDSQHVKVSQILAKSPLELIYHVFSSFRENLIWKMSPVVLSKFLVVFLNTLTADDKYPVEDWENLQLPMKCNYLKNEKLFLNFFFSFWNLHQILNILK